MGDIETIICRLEWPWSPSGKLSSDFMTLSMSKYEELGKPRCAASLDALFLA